MISFNRSTEYGVRRILPEINGSITPTPETLRRRMNDIAGFAKDRELGLAALCSTVIENKFDPETLTWTDSAGGRHSQKCPIRKIAENR